MIITQTGEWRIFEYLRPHYINNLLNIELGIGSFRFCTQVADALKPPKIACLRNTRLLFGKSIPVPWKFLKLSFPIG